MAEEKNLEKEEKTKRKTKKAETGKGENIEKETKKPRKTKKTSEKEEKTSIIEENEPQIDEIMAESNENDSKTVEIMAENEEIDSKKSEISAKNDENGEKNTENKEECAENLDERKEVEGILDIADDGFGFLRFDNFLTSSKDVYVSSSQIRRFGLRQGDKILGISRPPRMTERFGALLFVKEVNGQSPELSRQRPYFDSLTPIYADDRIILETSSIDLSTRVVDLVAPIGRGQRGLIVAQPKAGKTVLLKKIAAAVEEKYPDIELIVLLVDERPEEVTDMKNSLKKSEVIYSTFDEQANHHVKVASMVIERAKRLAEEGKDVMILLDSITRLARAYNLVVPNSGKTLSGGFDPGALHPPKKFFGTARNIEEDGSVTILATALVNTGSRMDDVIYEEFKGTGNMELHLDRQLSERRIFPAIDLNKSGTRRDDLLLSEEENIVMMALRRAMSAGNPGEITEEIIENLSSTKSNKDFVSFMLKKLK